MTGTRPGSRPTVSRPMSSLLRRAAGRDDDLVGGDRLAAVQAHRHLAAVQVPDAGVSLTSARRTEVAEVAEPHRDARARGTLPSTSSPANGSFFASSRRTPVDDGDLVDAQAAQPGRRLARHHAAADARPPGAGTSCMFVTSREVHGRASRSPGTGGTNGGAAGVQHDRVPGGEPPLVAVRTVTDHHGPLTGPAVPGRAPRRCRRRAAHWTCEVSSRCLTTVVPAGEHGLGVERDGRRPARSRPAGRARRRAPRPGAAAPCSACTPSRSIRRRRSSSSTITASRPENCVAYCAAFSPAAPPPSTMTSHSVRSGSTDAFIRWSRRGSRRGRTGSVRPDLCLG